MRLAGFDEKFPASTEYMDTLESASDQITILLVRWFKAHPEAKQRDSKGRPVCTGPLSANYCHYEWDVTTRSRHCIANERIWQQNKTILKLQPAESAIRRADLAHARFEFQHISMIDAYVSMNPCREWDPQRKKWGPVHSFLETVVVPHSPKW